MRGLLLVFIFLQYSCTSNVARAPSSIAYQNGEVSLAHSTFRLISTNQVNENFYYFFHFQTRDEASRLIDIDSYDLSLMSGTDKLLVDSFSERQGSYYYRLAFSELPKKNKTIKAYYQDQLLAEINLNHLQSLAKVDVSKSKMRVTGFKNRSYTFELELLDKNGQLVNSIQKPEILLEGEAGLQSIYPLGVGKWGGEVRAVDINSIIYLSIRLNSSYLPRLLRIQHIEK